MPRLHVSEICNTQLTVKDRIDGRGRQVPYRAWLCDLLCGRIALADIPSVRVAQRGRGGTFVRSAGQ